MAKISRGKRMNQAHIDSAVKKGHLILKRKLPGKPVITKGKGPYEKFAEITFQHKKHQHKTFYYKLRAEPGWKFDSMITR